MKLELAKARRIMATISRKNLEVVDVLLEKGPQSGTQIAGAIGIPLDICSQRCAALQMAGVVIDTPDGKKHIKSIDTNRLNELIGALKTILNEPDDGTLWTI